jgi:hypothetical protein
VLDEQVGKPIQDIVRAQMPGNLDRLALAGILVDHRQHAELTPVMGGVLDTVIGPHVVGPAWPQTDARSATLSIISVCYQDHEANYRKNIRKPH